MGLIETIFGRSTVVEHALAESARMQQQVEILRESVADLELAMEDSGWLRLTAGADSEFSRAGLERIAKNTRVFAVANPLVKRGLGLRQAYIFGQGVVVQARAAGHDPNQQDVNEVIQAWWDDPGNQASVFGSQAQTTLERALGTDGNVFIACFTNPRTGMVLNRTILFDEINDIVTNPDDRDEPWFYKRMWVSREFDTSVGRMVEKQKTAFYPALGHYPKIRPKSIDGAPVMWDTPVYHIKVNQLQGWAFGIGDAYAALVWARAYRDFLADWATLVKSLSQFAWKATTGGRSKSQKLREALARRPAGTPPAGNSNNAGATAVMDADITLEAIPKTGAVIDSDSGRPLATMVASALDVPVTALLSDPGQTGARAVAETLNLPTRLAMQLRQKVWEQAYKTLAGYAIQQSIKAPAGLLRGTVIRDPFTGREHYTLAGDSASDDATVEVIWPDLTDVPLDTLVKAIVDADGTGVLPRVEVLRLLLAALGVRDIDEIVDTMTDDNGNWIEPEMSAGSVAADAFRRGEDPAEALR